MAKEITSSFRRGTKNSSASLGVAFALARGVLSAVAVTVLGVVVSALVIRWLAPSDTVISVLNQALKLAAIFVGARACVGRGGTGGVLKGASVGFVYMLLGMLGYALLSNLTLAPSAYLADLGMGVASGGLCGMIMANLQPKK